ncbi:MAG: hypothetical protein IT305_16485 [Chloroflexi bacterium]|nr:hypothetical protein [Chloroflexota bacterium]
MAVFKSHVDVADAAGRQIGAGTTYVHLRLGRDAPQDATGTVSLEWWEPVGDPPAELRLEQGGCLTVSVDRDVLSDCSRNRIFRFRTSWPPSGPPPSPQ